MKSTDFQTRDSDSAKFVLVDVYGKDTDDFLLVEGVESTTWRKERHDRMKSFSDKESSPPVQDADMENAMILSVLVKSWSFDDKFSRDSVRDFLYNTPYILDKLDHFVFKRSNFLKKK